MSLKVNTGKLVTRIQFREINFSWTIEHFSLHNNKIGDWLESQKFPKLNDDKCEWCLQIYPNGASEQSKEHVSAYLKCIFNGTNSVIATYSFSFLDKNGKILKSNANVHKEFSNGYGNRWGLHCFIKRSELIPLLVDDVLVVNCTVKWKAGLVNVQEREKAPDKPDFKNQLVKDFRQIMDKGTFSDVELISSDGYHFSAHKCVLAARSLVFDKMFSKNENRQFPIGFTDMNADALKTMLEFIYTSLIDQKKCDVGMLAAANKYALEDLKALCEFELSKKLNVKNAAYYLLTAEKHKAKTLKVKVLEFVKTHLKVVLETEGMKNLSSVRPSLFYDIMKSVS